MTKPFDPTKPVQTRDGRPARILCTDAKNPEYPIVALVDSPDGEGEMPVSLTVTGRFHDDRIVTDDDLINIPPKVVRVAFHNVYSETIGTPWPSLEYANNSFNQDRIGVLKVTYYEDGTFDHEKVSDVKA